MVFELKRIEIAEMDVLFYVLNVLESGVLPCKGYVRVFPTENHKFFCDGANLSENWIKQSWLDFRCDEKKDKLQSWLQFALRNISIGIALRLLPPKACELCPSEWKYTDYVCMNSAEQNYILRAIEHLGFSNDIMNELKHRIEPI